MRRGQRTLVTTIILLLLAAALPLAQASAQTMAVSAVVLSKNNCQFNNPPSAALAFGALNPLTPVDVTVSANLSFVCRGADPVAAFLLSDDDGLHETGLNGNRMQHLTNPAAYLPYAISLSPQSGTVNKNVSKVLTVTGTVRGSDYQTALIGSYADIVTILIEP